jgi:hypothetical protein
MPIVTRQMAQSPAMDLNFDTFFPRIPYLHRDKKCPHNFEKINAQDCLLGGVAGLQGGGGVADPDSPKKI